MKPGLRSSVIAVQDLSPAVRQQMFHLMQRYYEGVAEAPFIADLGNKSEAILLHAETGELVGFSTLAVWRTQFRGQPLQVLFSGDTIIDQPHWGSPVFAASWLKLAARIKHQAPQLPLYWFLIVKGHRTYRFLDVFARTYYPSWQEPTPPDAAAFMQALAEQRFGSSYQPQRGIVHSTGHAYRLAPDWAKVPTKDQARPEVQFFLAQNPGFAVGDELVCLAEISAHNMPSFARRIFEAGQA
jgi:hypothetical protein